MLVPMQLRLRIDPEDEREFLAHMKQLGILVECDVASQHVKLVMGGSDIPFYLWYDVFAETPDDFIMVKLRWQ